MFVKYTGRPPPSCERLDGVVYGVNESFAVLGKGTKVEDVYLILLDTQILIYFIPYLYLFIIFLIHRQRGEKSSDVVLAPGGLIGGWLIGLSGFIVTLFAMIIATIPPPDTGDSLLFRLKVIGGALGFILIGGSIYWRARLKEKWNEKNQQPASFGSL